MNNSPKITVVILCWNNQKFLEKFLPSVIISQYDNLNIVIVDNDSEDETARFLQNHYPDLRVIRFVENLGFAKGYNEALKQIESDYYVILNSDVEVEKNWLHPMLQLLENNQEVAACQPKILCYDNRSLFEYAGAAGGWLDKYGYPFCKGRIFDVWETDQHQYEQTEPIFWASGAALFIRAKVFHEVGGFDEYFFAHQEEIDLCWRIQLAGYKVYSCPDSVVYHVGGGTLPSGNAFKTYLNFRNNRIMLSKNLPLRKKIWVMPYRSLLDAISAWKGLLTGNGRYFIAVIRAHVAFVRWWLFHRKKSVFPKSREGKLEGLLNGNVIWLHFAQKKRYFSEIVNKTK